MLSLLGIRFDANSSYLRGAAMAPPAIREALFCGSTNLWTEDMVDLGAEGVLHDAGDVELYEAIEEAVHGELDAGRMPICLGGDHSVTYPIIRGFARHFRDLTILQFDAHGDLYDEFQGNRFSHACQFARIMEQGLAKRLVQVGIRTVNQHQIDQAGRFGVDMITMRDLTRFEQIQFNAPLYISFDIDVLDPAFAPGVSHYEPGGMSVRETLAMIQSLRMPIVGADIVEYNPTRDRHQQTAMVAAKVLKEIAALNWKR
jgi:arginase